MHWAIRLRNTMVQIEQGICAVSMFAYAQAYVPTSFNARIIAISAEVLPVWRGACNTK
jgi:hypothetical protein